RAASSGGGVVSIQSEIEAGLLAALKTAPGLSTIKTFEDDIRDCLFADTKQISGFNPSELPAINLSASLDPTASSQFTMTETQHDVPVSIVVIVKAQKRKPAFDAVKQYQEAIEGVLNGFRRSGNSLGVNALLMGDVSSSAITIQDQPFCWGTGTTGFKITKITS